MCEQKCKKPCGSPTCNKAPKNCASGTMDAQCVVYHPCDSKPSLLQCIGAPNGITVERALELLDQKVCEVTLPNVGTWNLQCLESDADPITSLKEFGEAVADKLCELENNQILEIDPCPPIEASITDNKLKICINQTQLVQNLITNTQFINGVVNTIVTNPVLKQQFCCPFECALSVEISGLSCALCIAPTTPSIQGKLTPQIGEIVTYSYTILGGQITGKLWEVQGGTILGSATGDTVRIQWNEAGSKWVKLSLTGCNQTVPGQASISVACDPTDPECGCIPITQLGISGVSTPLSGAEQTYTYSGTGSLPRTFYWSVQGGSIVGRNDRSSVVIKWGEAGAGTLTLSVTGCGDITSRFTQPVTIGTLVSCTPVSLSEITGELLPKAGTPYTYSVTPTGTTPITYQWNASGGTIQSGGTTAQVVVVWDPVTLAPSGSGTINIGNSVRTLSVAATNCTNQSATKTIAPSIAPPPVGKGCGELLEGTYGATDNYIYPLYPLNLTQPTRLGWSAYDRPNRFDLLENGVQVQTTGWVGTATYAGPWGTSLSTQNTGILSVTPTPGKTYELRVTAGPSQGITDTWDVMIGCPTVDIISLVPTSTPGEFTLTYDKTNGVSPYTWELRNASGTLLTGGNLP